MTHRNYSCQGHESEFSISSLCPSCSWETLYNPAAHLCLYHKTPWYSTRKQLLKWIIYLHAHSTHLKTRYLDLSISWDDPMLPHLLVELCHWYEPILVLVQFHKQSSEPVHVASSKNACFSLSKYKMQKQTVLHSQTVLIVVINGFLIRDYWPAPLLTHRAKSRRREGEETELQQGAL